VHTVQNMANPAIGDVVNVHSHTNLAINDIYSHNVLHDAQRQNISHGDLKMKLRRVLEELFYWSNFGYLVHFRRRRASKTYNILRMMGKSQKCNFYWCRFCNNHGCSNPFYYESHLFELEDERTVFGCSYSPEWRKFDGSKLYFEEEERKKLEKWKEDGRLWRRK